MFDPARPTLILAPMEGVTDAPMRAARGEAGAFTFAVAEFVRVAHAVVARSTLVRHVPELAAGGRTPTGLPVQVQLLGGDPGRMAASAVVAHDLGATAVDLNFGCPARTVNNHDGGAALLRDPPRIRAVVAAVRAALPPGVPVSAKVRLGWDTIATIDEIADMAATGGAAWLTIHGRTRAAGYAPPIFWTPIGRVRDRLGIPVVANGDIWTIEDFRRCRDETGCRQLHARPGRVRRPPIARPGRGRARAGPGGRRPRPGRLGGRTPAVRAVGSLSPRVHAGPVGEPAQTVAPTGRRPGDVPGV